MTADEPHDHHVHGDGHGHVHLSEEDWAAYAAQTELQGEVFLPFLIDTISWIDEVRGAGCSPVQRILDIGSGPGVGTCQLAASYPNAQVTAVDSSPAMLARATERAARLGVGDRIDVRLAEMPAGVDDLAGVDVIWASMSLHHVGDQVAALRVLRALLQPTGLIAIAEIGGATRVLTDELDVGRPGFVARLDAVSAAWFTDMRHGLPGSVESGDVPSMLAAAGLDMIGQRLASQRLDAPLGDDARRVAHGELLRTRKQLGDRLDADDQRTLDILCDEDDPRGVMHRVDLFIAASQQIFLARPTHG